MQSLACPAVDAENPNSSSRLPLGARAALAWWSAAVRGHVASIGRAMRGWFTHLHQGKTEAAAADARLNVADVTKFGGNIVSHVTGADGFDWQRVILTILASSHIRTLLNSKLLMYILEKMIFNFLFERVNTLKSLSFTSLSLPCDILYFLHCNRSKMSKCERRPRVHNQKLKWSSVTSH